MDQVQGRESVHGKQTAIEAPDEVKVDQTVQEVLAGLPARRQACCQVAALSAPGIRGTARGQAVSLGSAKGERTMRTVVLTVFLMLVAAVASAQPPKVEIGGQIGYTLSEGVEVDGVTFRDIDPESGFSWGFDVGFFATRNVELGFLFAQEMSNLIGSSPKTDLVDLNVNNYHGFVAYNFGYNPELVPYFLFGMGATQYSPGDFEGQSVDGETKFSTTWGGGVKVFPQGKIGARFGVRWTPTYIKTDSDGYWCDPYWGCYTYGDVDYSHQFELSAGAVARF
jgi:hypothetical protein